MFLYDELNEEVFMERPCGYVQKGDEHKVYNNYYYFKRHFMGLSKHHVFGTVV